MGTVFSPAHPNNMHDQTSSGVAVGEDTTTGDTLTPAGQAGDQDDLPDFNTLGDKSATAQA